MPPRKKTELEAPVQVVDQVIEEIATPENKRPAFTSAEWNDWVLDQLRQEEKDPQGHPNIDGLRRLVEELLGEIIYSVPETVIGADSSNQLRSTVIHRIKVRWYEALDYNGTIVPDIREFGAAADVYPGNTDEDYARYPSATADTRAEARALRKALRLRKTVASEEITSVPVSESGLSGYIVKSQELGIDKLCKDMDINPNTFINSGSTQYPNYREVRYTTAQKMLEQLNCFLRDMSKIPDSIRGYDANWRKV